MGKAIKKSSEEALNAALDKLVMVCPNKKTYDELTSLMFQLYCGNDFGLGNFSLSFLDKILSLKMLVDLHMLQKYLFAFVLFLVFQ